MDHDDNDNNQGIEPTQETLPANPADQMRELQRAFSDEQRAVTFRIGQRLGRASMGDMIQKLLTVTDLLELQDIKNNKLYKGLEVVLEGKKVTITSFEQYCDLLESRSFETIKLELANLEVLGLGLFEAMRKIGVGPGKMRSLRALPEDGHTALLEAAQKGDKDDLLDLAEELIARHHKEKEQLSKDLDEAREDNTAKDAVIADKNKKIDDMALAAKRFKTLPPDEEAAAMRREIETMCADVELTILGTVRPAMETLNQHAAEHGLELDAWFSGMLDQIDRAVAITAADVGADLRRTYTTFGNDSDKDSD